MPHEKSDHSDLDDDRPVGNWRSRYDKSAWFQISIELIYLVVLLVFCVSLLIDAASIKDDPNIIDGQVISNILFGMRFTSEVGNWCALAISGLIGGTVFDLKWLYHSVAKGLWNRDRCLWRFIVPINSAMVSLFTGFLFASGIIPFLKNEPFSDLYTLLGSGFVFGYFSDNILAALQNLARKVFGTLDSDDRSD